MSNDERSDSIGQRVLMSTLWLAAWRWTARLLGMLSVVILARLLLPEDVGVVAIGMVVVGFFDVLIDLGTDRYLIRIVKPDRDDYDTAWTMRLALISATSVFIFLAAVPIADLFDDDRCVDVLRVLALANLIRGFSNIGLVMYQRELQFKKIALIGIAQRLTGVTTTIALAFILQNYWAMVFGQVAFRLAECLLSYLVHPHRPRLTVIKIGDQWEFSKWIVVKNVAAFLHGQGDQMVVAKLFGTEAVGLYSMAARVAQMPTQVSMKPVLLPVYSGLAKKQDDPKKFNLAVLQITEVVCVLVIPAVTLLATVSEQFVAVVLGAKWLPAAPLLATLVVATMVQVLVEPVVTTLTLFGRVRLLAVLHWVSAIVGIAVVVVVARLGDIEGVAQARAGAAVVLAFLYYEQLHRALGVSWRRFVECIIRPAAASVAMAAVTVPIANADYPPATALLLVGGAGSFTYIGVVYGLWRYASTPNSGEALLVRELAKLVRRGARRRDKINRP